MKEWRCVQVGHHKKLAGVIEELQMEGWRLHTYQAQGNPTMVCHYLLFKRGEDQVYLNKMSTGPTSK